jgi:hypothetical protein
VIHAIKFIEQESNKLTGSPSQVPCVGLVVGKLVVGVSVGRISGLFVVYIEGTKDSVG